MFDGDTGIHNNVDTSGFGGGGGFVVDDAELKPYSLGTNGGRFTRYRQRMLGATKNIDNIYFFIGGHSQQRRVSSHAKNFRFVRINRDGLVGFADAPTTAITLAAFNSARILSSLGFGITRSLELQGSDGLGNVSGVFHRIDARINVSDL